MSRVLSTTKFILGGVTGRLRSYICQQQQPALFGNQCGCFDVSNRLYSSSSQHRNSSVSAKLAENEPQQKSAEASVSSSKSKLDNGLVFSHERHNMYVCWHPEEDFPYEMTKPIDFSVPATESNLKIQALTPVREAFRKKHEKLIVQELVKLTYSTKHRFFGAYGKRKRLVFREMDPNKQRRNRPFL